MAHHWSDNVLTTAFTPRDYQVELLAAAREKNIIICLGHYSSKEFISLKLIHELGYELRSQSRTHKKATLYLTSAANSNSTYNLIYHLTDLRVINLNELSKNLIEWDGLFDEFQVVILNLELCLDGLICGYIDLNEINLIVIDDCHKNYGNYELSEIFNGYYVKCETKPKILGLAGPLHSAECAPGRLGGELEYLEKSLFSKAETASDIVTVLRYCSKPVEIILQCAPPEKTELTEFLRNLVISRRAFIDDHRFDPSEIYEGFLDELKVIPDPKTEPIKFLNELLEILNELGPWSADRAALLLLVQIEKCKINTPYERHYLLLCLISTTLVQIRAHCDYVFQKLANEKERIEKYSTPKVLRLLEILRKFKPSYFNSHSSKENSTGKQQLANAISKPDESPKPELEGLTPKNLENIESLDTTNFVKCADGIDKITENINNASTSSLAKRITDGLNTILNGPPPDTNAPPVQYQPSNRGGGGGYRKRFRQRGGYHNGSNHPFHHHSQRKYYYSHYQNESDALCGIIFCNSKFVAKILFGLLCDMTRNDSTFKFLNVQYTVDKEANPLKDLKEAEAEHRKQEEVLKRFRMHECNLLIGTSVLEEGIDLPKCNLVVRWDVPTTYRSYVQCKGRARAQNAYHIIMVSSHPDLLNETTKTAELYQKIHKFSCGQNKYPDGSDKDNLNSDEAPINKCTILEELMDHNQSENDNLELNKYFGNLDTTTNEVIERLAQYMEIEKMLIRKCENMEPSETELLNADKFTQCIEEYRPIKNKLQTVFVNLSTAVSLVNKYCAKLPSDTFTKLTPLWRSARTIRNGKEYFQCTLRLPINSPVKQDIIGFPMITRILARRAAALVACKILHEYGELDNNLQPIGKESFRASEPDWENFELEEEDEQIVSENSEPRPGTTKRRQYYYKRIASTFSKCRPNAGETTYLYHISMILTCPIPEEQNTRGRKIYPPEDALQGFGILTTKKIPKVSSFPIFTRSGEVKVSLELTKREIVMDETQLHKIYTFINYTFTNVLRLKKYLMLFDPEATENSFFIVPTIREARDEVVVDWNFLDLINDNVDKMPQHVPDEERKTTAFNPDKFKDAVVMPWYRNQDQPQYFYVAEICYHLSPNSSFPGENYTTFQEYYFRKYGIEIQNNTQPLLDVDHTSARLNFLTPRYVNRKGVALPTSSEETKRAKRENLEQKQILVPELCTIHPFPASLWRAAVCLPCILYRINALLLADEIRKQVALDLGLGKKSMEYEHFEWSTLDFGWSLADVLRKSREARIAQNDNLAVVVHENGYVKKLKDKEILFENSSAKIVELDEKFNNLSLEDAEKTANDLLEEADQKLKSAAMMEIGIWSNDMAESVEEDKENGWPHIPSNINICSRKTSQIRYGSPTSWDLTTATKDHQFTSSTENLFSDSDASYHTDDEGDTASNASHDNTNPKTVTNNLNGLRIEFKSDNVAEAIETEEELLKREKQLAIINDRNINEKNYQISKNICSGYNNCYSNSEDGTDDISKCENIANILYHEKLFLTSISSLKQFILKSNKLIKFDQELNIIQLGKHNSQSNKLVTDDSDNLSLIYDLVPYLEKTIIDTYLLTRYDSLDDQSNIKLKIDDLFELNKIYINHTSDTNDNFTENYTIEGTGDIFDNFNDQHISQDKEITINYQHANVDVKKIENDLNDKDNETIIKDLIQLNSEVRNTLNGENNFSFDYQPNLNGHPGPSPSIILQGLTMSNANDGINLERLETIGDSFLKYAITTYLYCAYENVHEGKLSHLRSKQVSNLNLYRLGRRKNLGENMIATKFEPHDNWLPPCYYVPRELEKALIEAKIPACHWNLAELPNLKRLSSDEICALVKQRAESLGLMDDLEDYMNDTSNSNPNGIVNLDNFPCFIPYNLVTQHSIPDKSIADCVEALIGAYLIECGPRGALLFMAWLGIRVLPIIDTEYDGTIDRIPGSLDTYENDDKICQQVYGHWSPPKSPLLRHVPNAEGELDKLLDGYDAFENAIGYYFNDRSYLLQAMTHASYSPNRLTDCYQRLEFLGDAVLDYLITRHLYEDPRQHSPGALTDLRSALVNNTIFASLAVRHGFHKYFRHLSPGLNEVIDRFVRIQHENGHSISEEFYLLSEEECDEAEDVEVPKALGDVFESVAGAIFLDSNMSLDTVWKIYSNMMRPEIEQFSNSVPKSPIRELLELEPETAKFGKPEKLADGRRVRVTVEVFGKGTFRGIGRNYRIAKCTAAKCALRQLKKQGLISKKH